MASYSAALRRNQNIVRNSSRLQSGPITATVVLIGLIISLALLYLNQVTKTSTFNYRITNLNNTKTNLEAEKQQLEIDAARLQSLAELKNSQAAANLVPVRNVTHISAQQ